MAGHLSLGLDPLALGPVVSEWVRLEARPPTGTAGGLSGEVVFVDRFGNLIANLPGDALGAPQIQPVRVVVNDQEVPRVVRAYADAPPGSLVALVSSAGLIEVAVVRGSAAERLRAGVGTPVTVTFPAAPPSA